MSLVVKMSLGERFINWFPFKTKLFLRGEKGADHAKSDALYAEVAAQFSEWCGKILAEEVAQQSAHERASGILEAAKAMREQATLQGKIEAHILERAATVIESLASQHPQPTAGQEVEDAGTLRINTHEETSDERIRELRETPMTLECFATLERVLSERHALLVDAANRAIASERATGKGWNDENSVG